MLVRSRVIAAALMATSAVVMAPGSAAAQRYEPAWAMGAPVEVRHPIYASKRETGVSFRVAPDSSGLTRGQRAELAGWLAHWRGRSGGEIVVRAPSGSTNEGAALAALDDVHVALRRAGISRRQVRFQHYRADGRTNAPVQLSSFAYVVEGPTCGAWPTNLARDPLNVPYWNFGCASQNNLAAMVANPADFIRPRNETPRASERRDVTWNKYVKGDATGAEKAENEKAAVSDVSE